MPYNNLPLMGNTCAINRNNSQPAATSSNSTRQVRDGWWGKQNTSPAAEVWTGVLKSHPHNSRSQGGDTLDIGLHPFCQACHLQGR